MLFCKVIITENKQKRTLKKVRGFTCLISGKAIKRGLKSQFLSSLKPQMLLLIENGSISSLNYQFEPGHHKLFKLKSIII